MSEIPDEESLFRRILPDRRLCVFADGRWQTSSQAFGDRDMKPSVDRASLCSGMSWTQEHPDNGVAILLTGAVRGIKRILSQPSTGPTIEYAIDVHPRPIKDVPGERDNPAHSQMEPRPDWATKSAFHKLKEALALLADVRIIPRCVRTAGDSDGVLSI